MTGLLSPPAVQLPSTLWVPARLGTYGDVINDFGDKIGIPRDAEQKRDIDCMASFGEGGRWLTLETAIIEGRQNGKTKAVLLTTALADLFLFNREPDRIVWTAHLMKTTLDTFERVCDLIESNAMLSKRVKQIVNIPTKESVILHNGSRMDFLARQGGGGRGLSGKRIVFDEALFLTLSLMGTLLPVLSSRDNPQVMYGSSAGKRESDHLRAIQARGRRGGDPSLILVEYRAPGGWDDTRCGRGLKCDHLHGNRLNDVWDTRHQHYGCAMDREENWRMANHAISAGRMRIEFTRAESRTLRQTPEGVLEFGRERMGWEELGGTSLDPDRIHENDWKTQTDPASEIVGECVFAIDMPPSGNYVSISAAGFREDGSIHFGVVKYLRGTSDAIKILGELVDKHETMCGVYWCPDAPIRALKTQIIASGITMVPVTMQEYADACGAMKEHILNGTAYHRGSEILNAAFTSSERKVRDEGGWIFGRRISSGDISPMVSSTLAVKGVDDNGDVSPGIFVI